MCNIVKDEELNRLAYDEVLLHFCAILCLSAWYSFEYSTTKVCYVCDVPYCT
jgi:hypothetical protein